MTRPPTLRTVVASAVGALLLAAALGASSAGGAAAACPKGRVQVQVNGKLGPCVSASLFFRRMQGDAAQDALVAAFTDGEVWRRLAGESLADELPDEDAAARWQRGVYQAAKRVLRKQTGGRELLSRSGSGFDLPGFAASISPPPGFLENAKSRISGEKTDLRKRFFTKKAIINAQVEGEAGKLDLDITTDWRLDACPDTRGKFTASKTLVLRSTLTKDVATYEAFRFDADLTGYVNENSQLQSFSLTVRTWAITNDDRIVDVAASLTDQREPYANRLAPPPKVFVSLSPGFAGSVADVLKDFVSEVTAATRDAAVLQLRDAFTIYFAEHRCNTMAYKPARPTLKPGQTMDIEAQMRNISRKKGDPEWKEKAVRAQGVEVVSVRPKGKSKTKIITIKALKGVRYLQSASGGASITVDGVSIRGRGLDSLDIEIVDDKEPPPPPGSPGFYHYALIAGRVTITTEQVSTPKGARYEGKSVAVLRAVTDPKRAVGSLPLRYSRDGLIVLPFRISVRWNETLDIDRVGTRTCGGSETSPPVHAISIGLKRTGQRVRLSWLIPSGIGLGTEDCQLNEDFDVAIDTDVKSVRYMGKPTVLLVTSGTVVRKKNATTEKLEWRGFIKLRPGAAVAGGEAPTPRPLSTRARELETWSTLRF